MSLLPPPAQVFPHAKLQPAPVTCQPAGQTESQVMNVPLFGVHVSSLLAPLAHVLPHAELQPTCEECQPAGQGKLQSTKVPLSGWHVA